MSGGVLSCLSFIVMSCPCAPHAIRFPLLVLFGSIPLSPPPSLTLSLSLLSVVPFLLPAVPIPLINHLVFHTCSVSCPLIRAPISPLVFRFCPVGSLYIVHRAVSLSRPVVSCFPQMLRVSRCLNLLRSVPSRGNLQLMVESPVCPRHYEWN